MLKNQNSTDQHARFLETARALGCEEDEAAFDEKLKAVAGPKAKETQLKREDGSVSV